MSGTLQTIDYLVIGLYMVFALSVGIYFSRRAGESSENYFLGGRSFSWWLVGISMVATSFASDTPIVITEMIREHGLQRIWWIFSPCIALPLGIFLFSRLWRRAEITTDAEFYEMRYAGKGAVFLRGLRAGMTGIVNNIITMTFVSKAMASTFSTLTGVEGTVVLVLCGAVALTYATLSGFYGVVLTDFVQFFIAVGSMIYLGVVAWSHVGGFSGISQRLAETPGYSVETLNLFPDFSRMNLDLFGLLIFFTLLWWTDWGGYHMQRTSSCQNEKNSVLANLFNAVFQTSRPWMWIVVALVSMVMFPGANHTQAYPLVAGSLLTPGLRGILVTGFLAAFMSTIDTHLNWGASYIMTDLYKRFMVKQASERHYMFVTRVSVVLLMICALAIVPLFESVTAAWALWGLTQAGINIVTVARWFWWRINAFTEITVMLGSACLIVIDTIAIRIWPELNILGFPWAEARFEMKFFAFVSIVIPTALVVTLLTSPDPTEKLEAFYRKIRPGGFWGILDPSIRDLPGKAASLSTVVDFCMGLMLTFGISLGIGYSLLGKPMVALAAFFMAFLGGVWVKRWFDKEMRAVNEGV